MAGEWIKVEVTTPDKPELMKLARILGIERDAVFGKLVRLWGWFDKNSVDGVVDGVVSTDVDALVGMDGFASAMKRIGWIDYDDEAERITLPNFDRHNGETAKKRALKTRRQQNWRQNRDASVDADVSTGASTREEKRREDKSPSEINTRKPKPLTVDALIAEGVNPELAAEWLALRKRKRAPLTPLAWKSIKAEAAKLGWTAAQAVEKANARGWQGFEAAWVERESRGGGANKQEALEQRNADIAERWANGGVQ